MKVGRAISFATLGLFTVFAAGILFVSLSEHGESPYVGRKVHSSGRSLLGTNDQAKRVMDSKKDIPRYNSKGERVSPDFDSGNMDYWESILMLAAVCVLVGLLCLLFGICFCCCRLLCNCCGGKKAREGCCCPGEEIRVYTSCERWWVRIAVLIVVVCIFAMGSMGYAANSAFSKGVDDMLKTLIDIADQIVDDITWVNDKFVFLVNNGGAPYNLTTQNAVAALKDTLISVKKSIQDARDVMKDVNDAREYALNICFGWALALSLFGVLGVLCSWGWPACILMFFGFFTLFLGWVMFGFIFPISVVMGDFCRAIDAYLDDRRACEVLNTERQDNLQPLVDCTSAEYTPTGRDLNTVIKCAGQEERAPLEKGAWAGIRYVLYGMIKETWVEATPTDPRGSTIRGYLKGCGNYAQWENVGSYRTIYENATTLVKGSIDPMKASVRLELQGAVYASCTSSESLSFNKSIAAYVGYTEVYEKVKYLTGCLYVLDAFDSIFSKLCIDTLQSLDLIAAAFGAIAFLYIFLVWFAILGMKRFKKPSPMESGVGAKPVKPRLTEPWGR